MNIVPENKGVTTQKKEIYKARYKEKRDLMFTEKLEIYNGLCDLYLQCAHLRSRRGFKNRATLFFMVECIRSIKDSFHHLYMTEREDNLESLTIRKELLYSVMDFRALIKTPKNKIGQKP